MQNAELTEGRVVLSNEEAMDELAADYAGKLLTDERAIARVMEENRTLGQRIREILRRIGEELRKIFGKSDPTLERAQALWDRAYEQAAQNAENGQKNTAREGAGRLALNGKSFTEDKYFERQIERWGELKANTRIKVGIIRENSALAQVGLQTTKMYFDVGKIQKAMQDHKDHLTPSVLKQIPDLLNDPIVITEYRGPEGNTRNTVNVYGQLFAKGKPVVVGIVMRLDSDGRTIINNIRTVHARSDFAKQITDDSVLYLNENAKRTRSWFHDCGNLNVPLAGTKYGFIRSITFENEKSKGKFSLAQTQDFYPRTKGRSFRGYSGKSPLSRAGYAMFTDDFLQAYDYTNPGRALWTVDNTKLQDVQELIPTIEKALLQGYENGTLPAEMDYLDEDGLRKLAGEADPEDIVMSAGLWDNEAALTYLSDAGVFDDVPGVKTRDGAVVFDEAMIEKDNPDWYTEDSETRSTGRYDLTDEEARKATEWEQAQMDKARDSLTRSCRQAFT